MQCLIMQSYTVLFHDEQDGMHVGMELRLRVHNNNWIAFAEVLFFL